MEENKNFLIKKIDEKQVDFYKKQTLYCCITWNSNGVMFSNIPTADKKYQEMYALSQSKHMVVVCIYSFDIDIPIFKK